MIFSRKKNQKSVIFLSDTKIKYVSLSRIGKKYHIEKNEQADIKSGVMKNAEVLEMEFLSQILTRIQENLGVRHVDVLLPHRFFEHKKISLDIRYGSERKMKQAFYAYVTKRAEDYPWITTHSFELMFYKTETGVDVHVQMLNQENYRALVYAFEKAGFTIGAIHSEDFSFTHVFSDDKKTLHIRVFDDVTRLSLFDRGIHVSDTDIDFSYRGLEHIYKKNAIPEDQVRNMMYTHGFLSTYEDQSVYRAVSQSMTSLLLLLKKHVIDIDDVQVSFESQVIPGFVDTLKKSFHTSIQLVDPTHFPKYLFSNIRSIHADKVSDYTTCILYLVQKMS